MFKGADRVVNDVDPVHTLSNIEEGASHYNAFESGSSQPVTPPVSFPLVSPTMSMSLGHDQVFLHPSTTFQDFHVQSSLDESEVRVDVIDDNDDVGREDQNDMDDNDDVQDNIDVGLRRSKRIIKPTRCGTHGKLGRHK